METRPAPFQHGKSVVSHLELDLVLERLTTLASPKQIGDQSSNPYAHGLLYHLGSAATHLYARQIVRQWRSAKAVERTVEVNFPPFALWAWPLGRAGYRLRIGTCKPGPGLSHKLRQNDTIVFYSLRSAPLCPIVCNAGNMSSEHAVLVTVPHVPRRTHTQGPERKRRRRAGTHAHREPQQIPTCSHLHAVTRMSGGSCTAERSSTQSKSTRARAP
jgi:hypothetical protein